ncbi:MAG: hypothetical protein U0470_09435 [Anaerolineae bacterium]
MARCRPPGATTVCSAASISRPAGSPDLPRPSTGARRINTNRFAWADYTDADGARRRYVLPIPVVDVITPTPSPTPTATATPVPPRVYLPIALNERCRPTTSPVDAVLVLDASTSMLERIADGRTSWTPPAARSARSSINCG